MILARSKVLACIAGVSLAAVAVALVTQHGLDMQPCPWCVLQRLIFLLIAVVALAGLAARSTAAQRGVAFGLLLLCSAGIAAVLCRPDPSACTA